MQFFEDHHPVFQPTLPCLYRAVTRHIGFVCKSRRRYRKWSVNYYSNSVATFILEYLLWCGEINPNPGPDSSLFDALHTVRDNGKQGISIRHSNVRGLRKNLTEVKLLLEHTNLDVLTVSETHFTNDIHNGEVKSDGYNILRRGRTHKAGGGVAFCSKTLLDCARLSKYDDDDIEAI